MTVPTGNKAANEQKPLVSSLPASEQLLKELQTSLNINKVLTIFAQFISRHLPLKALSFCHHQENFPILNQVSGHEHETSLSTLYVEQQYLGELTYTTQGRLNSSQKNWMKSCEQQLLYPLRNALLHHEVCNQAVRDQLTNLGNRVLLEEVLAQLLNVQERSDLQYAVMLIDLDNFQQFNQNHGHTQGDKVLIEFAHLLREQLRSCDQLFRFGGDEFLIIVANPDESALQLIFRRLQLAISDNCPLNSQNISCCAGAVMVKPAHTADSLLEDARQALLLAKNKGPNYLEAPLSFSQTG
ncbi:hypothetical protein CWE09_04920 [Aliidiomarina minuta]|uniref:diguanylate cyclase n=1 Tax=Aliidiomarina minuta TaxID=880057 RepID=A0A432W7Q7_9GAMM|nr:GGDEF domain-containing protein [Aliidiomarina minuta]RUO26072.1 hypothetical protein CWE09_04920 [Aliidiomarina minuta]